MMAAASFGPELLMVVTFALLALPITPALYELRKRADASPLPTSRHDGRIANFAESLSSRLEPLRPQLEICRTNREISSSSLEGMNVLLVGSEDFDFHPDSTKDVEVVMCSERAVVPANRVVAADVHASQDLELGDESTLRAAISEGDITLAPDSTVQRWLHARGNIQLRKGSSVYGRLSSEQSIRLEPACSFEHMNAPTIVTLDSEDAPHVPVRCGCASAMADAAHGQSASEAPGSDVFAARPRIRVQGDFALPAGETLNANVVATGDVLLGRGARFLGSAKSYGNVVLDNGSCAHGSIVCEGEIRIGPRCFVAGPIMAEREIIMARGSCVGEKDAPTTVSSRSIKLAAGCELHGSVWARSKGIVEG